ncbi:DUF6218 family protein [Amycolatopsis australiensis]|uniref:DUF6218 family protein n=1 Tax=Amycolatopsis australiensis TaxID=546364 RepID=UPI003CCBEC3E
MADGGEVAGAVLDPEQSLERNLAHRLGLQATHCVRRAAHWHVSPAGDPTGAWIVPADQAFSSCEGTRRLLALVERRAVAAVRQRGLKDCLVSLTVAAKVSEPEALRVTNGPTPGPRYRLSGPQHPGRRSGCPNPGRTGAIAQSGRHKPGRPRSR